MTFTETVSCMENNKTWNVRVRSDAPKQQLAFIFLIWKKTMSSGCFHHFW